jgi:hypothetical protein
VVLIFRSKNLSRIKKDGGERGFGLFCFGWSDVLSAADVLG